MRWIALLLALFVGSAGAQVSSSRPLLGDKWTTAPAACAVGQIGFDTDATAGANIYGCTAANTWTAQGGTGTVSTISFTGGLISIANPTTTPALTVAGTSGGIPYFSGTTTWASSGLLTANALMLGGGAGAAPTALGSLGTTTTLLHGNAVGAPTFGAVSLTADVSGILPTANGGTGIAYFTAAGPTVARVYTFPDAAATIARTDAGQTFTGVQAFNGVAGEGISIAAGTATTDVNALSLTQTWNAAGVTFTALKLDVTSTASAAASLLIDLQVATASKFSVTKAGALTAASTITSTSGLFGSPTYNEINAAAGTAVLLSVAGVRYGVVDSLGMHVGSGDFFGFTSGTDPIGTTNDTALGRNAAGVVEVNSGTAGTYRDFIARDAQMNSQALTAGTMTVANSAYLKKVLHKFTWTNAMVTALGAVTAGDILVGTLPAKTVVTNAYMVVDTAETALTSLTGAVGRTGATYIDYIVASSLKAAANTIYGDSSGERGTNLTGYDAPSYTATTGVYLHLISGVENLSTALACTGTVFIETMILP